MAMQLVRLQNTPCLIALVLAHVFLQNDFYLPQLADKKHSLLSASLGRQTQETVY